MAVTNDVYKKRIATPRSPLLTNWIPFSLNQKSYPAALASFIELFLAIHMRNPDATWFFGHGLLSSGIVDKLLP